MCKLERGLSTFKIIRVPHPRENDNLSVTIVSSRRAYSIPDVIMGRRYAEGYPSADKKGVWVVKASKTWKLKK